MGFSRHEYWSGLPFSSPVDHVLMWELYHKESWVLKNYFEVWCWRRLLRVPRTARRSNQSIQKSVLNIHWKDWCWSWNSNTLAMWCEELTHWNRPWCWERLKAGGEGDNRGCDGWKASPIWWAWVWASSRYWWRTGKPGLLQSMGFQSVRHDWATELKWTYLCSNINRIGASQVVQC